MKYYLWINETQDGPYEDWEILKKLTDKKITLETLACEGAAEPKWIKVSEIPAIRWSSDFGPKPQPAASTIGAFESSVRYFSSSFGRIYLLLGVISAVLIAIFGGDIPIAVAVLLSAVAAGIFFIALGEIIRILNDIRSELKNRRSP